MGHSGNGGEGRGKESGSGGEQPPCPISIEFFGVRCAGRGRQ
jgi:hypothetical protein